MAKNRKKSLPPSYRYYKPRDCAIVRIHGKDYYLGEYGSSESKQRYAQLIAEKWVECPDENTARVSASQKKWPTVDELIARFMVKHVRHHYLNREGKPSERYKHIQVALRALHELYGNTPVDEFGSKRFLVIREQMILP